MHHWRHFECKSYEDADREFQQYLDEFGCSEQSIMDGTAAQMYRDAKERCTPHQPCFACVGPHADAATPTKPKRAKGLQSSQEKSTSGQQREITDLFTPLTVARADEPDLPPLLRPWECAEDLDLDAFQLSIIKAAETGESMFITGLAGTGKSRVLRAIYQRLRLSQRLVFQVAPTGVAAANIGGQTIHSWCGISGAQRPPFTVTKKAEVLERVRQCDTLVIDEISMVDNHLLQGLHLLMCEIRRRPTTEWFGGYASTQSLGLVTEYC